MKFQVLNVCQEQPSTNSHPKDIPRPKQSSKCVPNTIAWLSNKSKFNHQVVPYADIYEHIPSPLLPQIDLKFQDPKSLNEGERGRENLKNYSS